MRLSGSGLNGSGSGDTSVDYGNGSGTQGLNIGIVGAGIAGLGAAIALRRGGHDVEIFERSKFAYELGAALNLCPNATKVLTRWGFDFVKSRVVIAHRRRILKAETLDVLLDASCGDNVGEYGAEWYLCHRVDLHRELLRLATEGEGDGKGRPARIRLDSEVVAEETDVDLGVLKLKSGEVVRKDLIVAADGLHSPFASKVADITPVTPSGYSAFRFLIPKADLLADPLTATIFNQTSGTLLNAVLPPHRMLVMYPCRSETIINFVCIHPSASPTSNNIKQPTRENWHVPSTSLNLNALLEAFPNAHPAINAIFAKATDIKLWPLLQRRPLNSWHRVGGRCVVIGDAAHPMLPFQGQAGALALEDACALGVMLSGLESAGKRSLRQGEEGWGKRLESRIKLFEEVRRKRADGMQFFSNMSHEEVRKLSAKEFGRYINVEVSQGSSNSGIAGGEGGGGKDKEVGEVGGGNASASAISPEEEIELLAKAFTDWKFGHDVFEESWKVLREAREGEAEVGGEDGVVVDLATVGSSGEDTE